MTGREGKRRPWKTGGDIKKWHVKSLSLSLLWEKSCDSYFGERLSNSGDSTHDVFMFKWLFTIKLSLHIHIDWDLVFFAQRKSLGVLPKWMLSGEDKRQCNMEWLMSQCCFSESNPISFPVWMPLCVLNRYTKYHIAELYRTCCPNSWVFNLMPVCISRVPPPAKYTAKCYV